jgi:hypothetical protein
MPTTDTTVHQLSTGFKQEISTWTGSSSMPAGSAQTGYEVVTVTPKSRSLRTWIRTPDFHHKKVNNLPLPDNAFSFQKTSGRGFFSGTRISHSHNPFQGSLTVTETWSSVPSNWSELPLFQSLVSDDELFIKARLAIQDKRTWDAQLFGAELHRTTALVANAARDVSRAMSHIKRLRFGDAMSVFFPERDRRFQRGAANGFLAFKYGVLPVMKDVNDAIDALSAVASRKLDSAFPSKVVVSIRRNSTVTEPVTWMVSPSITGSRTIASSDSRRMTVVYRVGDPLLYSAARFGVTNPVSTVYNLVPFSFVADWFFNVGDWLSSLDAGVGLDILSCYSSRKQEYALYPGGAESTYLNTGCSVGGSAHGFAVNRIPYPGLPTGMPQGILWSPGLLTTRGSQQTVSGSRLASAIAILRQLT